MLVNPLPTPGKTPLRISTISSSPSRRGTTYRADGRLLSCGFFVLMTRPAHESSCPDEMRVSFGRERANLTLGATYSFSPLSLVDDDRQLETTLRPTHRMICDRICPRSTSTVSIGCRMMLDLRVKHVGEELTTPTHTQGSSRRRRDDPLKKSHRYFRRKKSPLIELSCSPPVDMTHTSCLQALSCRVHL